MLKKHFDAELWFTDTDSLTYETKSDDVYEELFKHKHFFDFSNYPKDSKFFDEANKNVIGKMIDEFEENMVAEFFGLKSEMYSIKKIDDKECNTAKGVSVATEFNKFKDVLFNKKIMRHKMRTIQTKKHKIGTYKTKKKSLSVFDSKRSVSDDGIHTQAYFYKDLKKRSHISKNAKNVHR